MCILKLPRSAHVLLFSFAIIMHSNAQSMHRQNKTHAYFMLDMQINYKNYLACSHASVSACGSSMLSFALDSFTF